MGWVDVSTLLSALAQHHRAWQDLNITDLEEMMRSSDKQRFELQGARIRAFYGHSLPGKLARTPAQPPEILLHGTAPATAELILKTGLKPMGRQFVHLSVDVETATKVGARKAKTPVILRVAAAQAFAVGIQFYHGNESVWLADEIPSTFIIIAD